jgi:hypothetical protein
MAGLLHDVPLMLAALGGRGCETGAQGVATEVIGRQASMSNVTLDDQCDGSIAEALGTNFPTLRDRAENRTLLDPGKFEPRLQQCDRAGFSLSSEGDPEFGSLPFLVHLG